MCVMYTCVRNIDFTPVSTIFRLDFGTVPYFCFRLDFGNLKGTYYEGFFFNHRG